jgi:hypothetical protein
MSSCRSASTVPRHRPRRELRPWRREGVVLGPRRSRTSRLPAPPDPLEPPHPHRAGEAGRVVQHLDTATVTDRHHTAVRAPGQRWSDSTSSTSTPSSRVVTSRTWRPSTPKISSARAHQEVSGAHVECNTVRVFRSAGWSPLIVKALTPSTPLTRRRQRSPQARSSGKGPLRTRRPKSVAAHSSGPGLTSTGPGTVTAMVCHAIRPVIQDSGQQDHGNRDLNQYSGGRSDRPDCGRGAHVSQVLACERTVAVEANPRAISQMANVSSNNPPGMAATIPAPATPNSSSRLPAAKHA